MDAMDAMNESKTDLNTSKSPDHAAPNNPGKLKRVLEAVLLSSQQPLTPAELRKVFLEEIGIDVVRVLLDELRVEWSDRPLELVQLASGWRFAGCALSVI